MAHFLTALRTLTRYRGTLTNSNVLTSSNIKQVLGLANRSYTSPTFNKTSSCVTSDMKYILPTVQHISIQKQTVLDPRLHKTCTLPPCLQDVAQILPTLYKSPIVEDPTSRNKLPQHKECRNVLKYRRRRMNRHKLKKLRKKMQYVYAKIIRVRKKRKEEAFVSFLDGLEADAEKFDAVAEVKDKLAQARKGGFKIDIFAEQISGNPTP